MRGLYILAFVLPGWCFGQIEFTASVNRNVATTDNTIVYEISSNVDGDITPPDFDGFKIVGGPNHKFLNFNGNITLKYQYYLRPIKTGKITIEPARLSYRGKKETSQAIEMTIKKGESPLPGEGGKEGAFNGKDPLVARMIVNKSNVYVGEPIVVTHKIYSPYNIRRLATVDRPTQGGFSRSEIQWKAKNASYQVQRERINGKVYNTVVIHKELLTPQEYGQLKLEPFEIEVVIVTGGFIFQRTAKAEAKSNSPTITVRPLPDPKPANFSGAVGDFSISAELSKEKLKVNEGLDLTLTVSGTGNLKYIEEPQIDFPSDFDVELTETDERIQTSTGGMKGSVSYNYFLIPRVDGEFTLDNIKLSYFDLQSKNYDEVSIPPLSVTVEKGASTDAALTYTGPSEHKRDVEAKKGLRFIKTDTQLREKGPGLIGTTLWWGGIAAPGLAFVLLLLLKRKRASEDPEEARERAAGRIVKKHLSQARSMLESGNTDAYYEECQRAMYEYLKDKFHMDMSEISNEQTRSRLRENGIDEATTTLFADTIEKCEMARYAPLTPSDDREIYDSCVSVIKNIEKQMK